MARQGSRNSDCSVFVGNLDKRVTEELLWELFLQAGPIKNIYIPSDKETGKQKAFGFVEFSSSVSAHYAGELLDGIKLFDRALTVRPQQKDAETTSCTPTNQMAANIFYKQFYDTYDELKRRPQSEPRRIRQEEESYHHSRRNNSFNVPYNRSFSSPAHQTTSPVTQNWTSYNGLLYPDPRFINQNPPSHPYWYH